MMGTLHRIDVKQIREAFKELKDIRNDIRVETNYREIRALKRREKRIRELIARNSKTYAIGE